MSVDAQHVCGVPVGSLWLWYSSMSGTREPSFYALITGAYLDRDVWIVTENLFSAKDGRLARVSTESEAMTYLSELYRDSIVRIS